MSDEWPERSDLLLRMRAGSLQALQGREKDLIDLADLLPQDPPPHFLLDRDGRLLYLTKECARIVEYCEEDLRTGFMVQSPHGLVSLCNRLQHYAAVFKTRIMEDLFIETCDWQVLKIRGGITLSYRGSPPLEYIGADVVVTQAVRESSAMLSGEEEDFFKQRLPPTTGTQIKVHSILGRGAGIGSAVQDALATEQAGVLLDFTRVHLLNGRNENLFSSLSALSGASAAKEVKRKVEGEVERLVICNLTPWMYVRHVRPLVAAGQLRSEQVYLTPYAQKKTAEQ